jgi:hypothetical protein
MLPCDFLCPYFYNEKTYITSNTRSIHKYAMTWLDENERLRMMEVRNNTSFLFNKTATSVKVEKEFSYEQT